MAGLEGDEISDRLTKQIIEEVKGVFAKEVAEHMCLFETYMKNKMGKLRNEEQKETTPVDDTTTSDFGPQTLNSENVRTDEAMNGEQIVDLIYEVIDSFENVTPDKTKDQMSMAMEVSSIEEQVPCSSTAVSSINTE